MVNGLYIIEIIWEDLSIETPLKKTNMKWSVMHRQRHSRRMLTPRSSTHLPRDLLHLEEISRDPTKWNSRPPRGFPSLTNLQSQSHRTTGLSLNSIQRSTRMPPKPSSKEECNMTLKRVPHPRQVYPLLQLDQRIISQVHSHMTSPTNFLNQP